MEDYPATEAAPKKKLRFPLKLGKGKQTTEAVVEPQVEEETTEPTEAPASAGGPGWGSYFSALFTPRADAPSTEEYAEAPAEDAAEAEEAQAKAKNCIPSSKPKAAATEAAKPVASAA